MINQTELRSAAPSFWRRVLAFPISQIVVAILFIAIPFAVVSTPFNLFVTDKPLRRAGALLLTAIVLGAYWAFVRIVERRAVTELSSSHVVRELGGGTSSVAFDYRITALRKKYEKVRFADHTHDLDWMKHMLQHGRALPTKAPPLPQRPRSPATGRTAQLSSVVKH